MQPYQQQPNWQPQYRTPQMVVVRPERKTHHGIHAMLTVATCGLWAPVWLVVYLGNRAKVEYR